MGAGGAVNIRKTVCLPRVIAYSDGRLVLDHRLVGYAGVVELVDAPDSKSGSFGSVGSIPTARTIFCHRSRQPAIWNMFQAVFHTRNPPPSGRSSPTPRARAFTVSA